MTLRVASARDFFLAYYDRYAGRGLTEWIMRFKDAHCLRPRGRPLPGEPALSPALRDTSVLASQARGEPRVNVGLETSSG